MNAITSQPLEVVQRILYFLEPKDRFSVRSTCKCLRDIVDGAWKDVYAVSIGLRLMPIKQSAASGGMVSGRRPIFWSVKKRRVPEPFSPLDDESSLAADCLVKASVEMKMKQLFSGIESTAQYSFSPSNLIPCLAVVAKHTAKLGVEIEHAYRGGVLSDGGADCLDEILSRLATETNFLPEISGLAVLTCQIMRNKKWLRILKDITGSRHLKDLSLALGKGCGLFCPLTLAEWTESRIEMEEYNQMFEYDGTAQPVHGRSVALSKEDITRMLQDVLDAGKLSLEHLSVDSLLQKLPAPLMQLNYPPLLRTLETNRLGEVLGDIKILARSCQNLEEMVIRLDKTLEFGVLINCEKLKKLTIFSKLSLTPSLTTSLISSLASKILAAQEQDKPVWPILESFKMFDQLNNDLLVALGTLKSLKALKLDTGGKEEGPTERSVIEICKLPEIQHLTLTLPSFSFGDTCLDYLGEYAVKLETLSLKSSSFSILSIPRLLRKLPSLKFLDLTIALDLETLDCVVLLKSMASDLGERVRSTDISVSEICGGTYESVYRIIEGTPKNCEIILSDLTSYCLHGLKSCGPCKFRDKTRSLILGRNDLGSTNNAVVFYCCTQKYS